MKSKQKLAVVLVALALCAACILFFATTGRHSSEPLSYSGFLASVRGGRISAVTIMAANSGAVEAVCRLSGASTARTILPADYRDALAAMQQAGVNVEIRVASTEPVQLLLNCMPFVVLLAFWIFLMTRANGPRLTFLR